MPSRRYSVALKRKGSSRADRITGNWNPIDPGQMALLNGDTRPRYMIVAELEEVKREGRKLNLLKTNFRRLLNELRIEEMRLAMVNTENENQNEQSHTTTSPGSSGYDSDQQPGCSK